MPSESPTLLESRLPPELECRIFEIVALARLVSIPSLMLVAKRVKEWHSLFFHVTHLELLDLHGIGVAESDSMCGHLALIPHLTHVAFNPKLHESVSHVGLSADLRLQCIVFLVSAPYELADSSPLLGDSFLCIQQTMD
ncbi:hypothetical protein B0H14DRAFT_3884647 [Mycena olivaceomarginata]|nr:hypothetical protein B0H14DRAFT_3884647 [Mycena olivaceomarginata]